MESPKVINKVLLSSVAFGVSFGIGMLVSKADIKKALTTGAIAIPASLAGALVSERKKADGENLVEDSLPTGVQELKIQEDGLHQSIAEATMRMQEVEAGINSLQTEHTQLLENISDLNSQKQQLESQKEAIETSIAVQQTELEQISDRFIQAHQQQEELDAYLTKLESRKQELETENQNLQAQIHELEQQHAQLAQAIAPLEEEPAESEAFEDRSGEELISFASEESLEDLKDTDESSATSWNELTLTEAESDNSVGEVEGVCLEELGNLSEEAVSVAVELTDEESIPVETPMDEMEEIGAEQEISVEQLDSIEQEQIDSLTELELTDEDSQQLDNLFAENPIADDDYALEESAQAEFTTEDFVASEELMEEIAAEQEISVEQLDSIEQEQIDSLTELELTDEDSQQLDNLFAENSIADDDYALEESAQAEFSTEDFVASEELMEEIAAEQEISVEQLDSIEQEQIDSLTELKLTDEDSQQLDNLFAENSIADDDYALEESAQAEFSTEDFVASEELMEEIAAEQEISVEQLDSIEQEQIDSLTELELTDEDSQQLDNLFAENPVADDDYALEESAQAEFSTEDFVASEQLIDYMEGIGFETTEQSSWAELDNFEEENATIVFSPSESMAEDSEELDNLFDSTTTFDSESLENLMDETAELGILDIVGELAQPESVESKIEKSVTLEGLMSQESQEAQTELTKELDEHFFNSITEATEEESTDTEQKSERLDYFINSSYTSESSELETAHGESEFLENLIDNTEENFLENFESVEKLPETEINEGSTIDHFLNESLDLEDSFDRWEETSEEFDRLDDLATSISMSESSIQEELEIVDEKIGELDTISEASLEEFKDLLESMDEENTSISFSDDVDDIETTKIQNLWD
jgi:hypothetical protein